MMLQDMSTSMYPMTPLPHGNRPISHGNEGWAQGGFTVRGMTVITGQASSQVPKRNVPTVSPFHLGANRANWDAEGFSFLYLTQPNREKKSLSLPIFPNAWCKDYSVTCQNESGADHGKGLVCWVLFRLFEGGELKGAAVWDGFNNCALCFNWNRE